MSSIQVELLFRNDSETSLRLRQERLKRNEVIEKKLQAMKSKLNHQSSVSSSSDPSILTLLITRYRRPFFLGLFTILTGSVFLYKFLASHERAR